MTTVLVDLGAAPASWGQLALVAQEAPPPGKGAEFGKASPIGLVVILLLAVATVFLIRSMSKRIRRLPASFDPPADPGSEEPPEGGRPAQPASANDADDPGSGRV
jgi:hypothetical protein